MPSTSREEENYNCFLKIMNIAVCEGLREIFKQKWDKHYGATKVVWDDTPISGHELYNMEKTKPRAKDYLQLFKAGKRSEWDSTALSYAILYSNALRMHLAPHVLNEVNELRRLRNNMIHPFAVRHKMSDVAFKNAYKKIKNCFNVLLLPTADVERIRNSSKRSHVVHLTKMTYICLAILVTGLIFSASYCWFTNDFEAKSLFRVLPTRPVHLVANRTRTVNAILEELRNLSRKSKLALTYLYISRNPGSGKSQLARLVGQRYDVNIPGSWFRPSTSIYVMTLNGRSLDNILESYVDFARNLHCSENNTASIRNSNQTTTETKIQSLKTEIAKTLRNFQGEYTLLLIVDNVVKLNEISSFLPQLEDEDWQGGQVLITTQAMSSVPPNSSLTVHISVSQGMEQAEACEFLTDLSGLVENQELVRKVARELDYQPLALASAAVYVQQLRVSKASPQFSWKNYLKKLDEGKRNITEMKLSEVNERAYPLTMSTAVLIAVKMFAESDTVLGQAFTFLSYVSFEPLTLDVVVSYILRVERDIDKEDIRLRILQCSMILPSEDDKTVSFSLHRVIHDSFKLYNDTEQGKKSTVVFNVFQVLIQRECAFCKKTLIPHLKSFSVITVNLTEVFVPDSIDIKHEILINIFRLSSMLIRNIAMHLSENYLTLAVKISTNESDEDNLDLIKEELHISSQIIGAIYSSLGAVEASLGKNIKARKYSELAVKVLLKQRESPHKSVLTPYDKLLSLGLTCDDPKECIEFQIDFKLELEHFEGELYVPHCYTSFFRGDLLRADENSHTLTFKTFYKALYTKPDRIILTLAITKRLRELNSAEDLLDALSLCAN